MQPLILSTRRAIEILLELSDNFISMSARENSAKPTSYDVAPAHDADSVQTAPSRAATAPAVSEAAVAEIKANADEAVAKAAIRHASQPRASELRGEEFDFDFTAPPIASELVVMPPKPKYGWAWLLLVLALLICVYTFGAVNGEKSRRPLPIGPFTAASAKPITVKVQVAGAVNKPGVYELPFNARVQDAIRKAGGFKSDADKSALNLADWAQDGAKIEVPSKAAPAPTATPTVIIKEVPVPAAPSSATAPDAASAMTKTESGIPLAVTESGAVSTNASLDYLKVHPVDLNKATQAELEVLPGVGPKMAERILAYRAENGGFKSVDELDKVKGIGEKRMATLKPLVKVR